MNKILIVDDSATMRKIIARVLRQADVAVGAVLEAANGVEGLARLASDPDIALILSDVDMPEMNGAELVAAVRAERDGTSLPVVMISTEGSESTLRSAMARGANAYVTKPFTPDSIRAVLEGLVPFQATREGSV